MLYFATEWHTLLWKTKESPKLKMSQKVEKVQRGREEDLEYHYRTSLAS